MIIIETCPICGNDLIDTVICTYPSRPHKYCPYCGWSWTGEPAEIKRIPFGGNNYNPIQTSGFGFQSNSCANCPTNPKNGGTGVCLCTLGLRDITC